MGDATFQRLFAYSDWANLTVVAASKSVAEVRLDESIDIGPAPGSLRRILLHTLGAERVWLSRCQGNVENAWPNEHVLTALGDIASLFEQLASDRQAFLSTLDEARLAAMQTYRDSKGSLYQATLRDMLIQAYTHATHHRAQAVNAIRRLGGQPPEVDYMYHVRQPA